MKTAIYDAQNHRVSIEVLPDPRPGPGDLLVKVCRCGICGSDVSMTMDSPFTFASGQFGHEYSGEVIEVGRDVASHKVGDRVAVVPTVPCGACENCRRGRTMLCLDRGSASQGFGEYAVIPPKVAIHLPHGLSMADGALVEPMACGLHALNMAGFERGERVLVIGAGTMALSVVFWARRLGAGRVVVLSRSAHRAEQVMAMGADRVLGFDPDDRARVNEALGGPPHVVAECVGKAGMIGLAIDHAPAGATVLAMGMCMHTETILPALCTFKEVRLLFPFGYTIDEFAQTARAFDSETISPDAMVTEVIALDRLPARLDAMRAGQGGGKVHVDPFA